MNSISAKLFDRGQLAASFFFPANANSAETSKVLPTIAFGLAECCPAYRRALSAVVKADIGGHVTNQFRILFEQSLGSVAANVRSHGWAVVVDAFDQCTGNQAIELEQCLRKFPSSLKLIVSSRFSPRGSNPSVVTRLDFAELTKSAADMEIIVRADLVKVRDDHDMGSDWPDKHEMGGLMKLVGDLPLISNIVARLLIDSDNPSELLGDLSNTAKDSDFNGEINEIYGSILKRAFSTTRNEQQKQLQTYRVIIGTLIVAHRPLERNELLAFATKKPFCKDLKECEARLQKLSPLVWCHDGIMRFIHPTFIRYVTNPDEVGPGLCDDKYRIDAKICHESLALAAFDCLNGLSHNVCQLGYDRDFDEDVVRQRLDQDDARRAYSSCFVQEHLQQCGHVSRLSLPIRSFATDHLLHWLEVLSGLREVGRALPLLRELRKTLEVGRRCLLNQSALT